MTDLERIADLERLARAATPGEREHKCYRSGLGGPVTNEVKIKSQKPPLISWQGFDDSDRPPEEHTANAALAAATDPDTLLWLIGLARPNVELKQTVLRLRFDLQTAYQQLAYLWNDTRSCPCGARKESPTTHPHVIGCPTGKAAALKETKCSSS